MKKILNFVDRHPIWTVLLLWFFMGSLAQTDLYQALLDEIRKSCVLSDMA